MMRKTLNEKQIRVVLSAFESIKELPYEKQMSMLGSLGVKEMHKLHRELNDWYQEKVNGKIYDYEMGWINPYEF